VRNKITPLQKIGLWVLSKATGFPTWRLTDSWPGGAASVDGWNPREPLQLAAVYGCSRVLAQTIGTLPFHLYREDPRTGKREKATDDPLYEVLHLTPNPWMTSTDLRESMILGFCLRGNGYAEIGMIGSRTVSLTPLRADRMQIVRQPSNVDRPIVYRFAYDTGKTEEFPPEKILHVKNFSLDGLEGITPVRRHIIELAQSAQDYGRNFFKNSGRPSGILKSDQKRPVGKGATDEQREEWNKVFQGPDSAGKTAVLWYGLDYKPILIPPDEAQFLQSRQMSAAEVCALYGVPLSLLGLSDKSETYASSEQFDIRLTKHAIRPLSVRFEQAVNRSLLRRKPNMFVELDLDGLLRGDASSQATTFSTYTQNGIMARNEVRRKLNLPEVDGADELTVQSNLIDLDKLASVTNRRGATSGGSLQ
jgi:HK97 family phage portal protein